MILTVTLNAAVDSTWIVENFTTGSNHRVNKGVPLRVAGGKGINVARVIDRLGEDVLATGFVGGDMGKFIEKKLTEEKINHEFIHVGGESRECLTIVDPVKKNNRGKKPTEINGAGPEISTSEVKMFKNLYLNIVPKCKVICLCGSLPPGVPKDIYAYLIKKANEKKVPVILDASNDALNGGIIAEPFMVKLNTKEVKEVLPDHNVTSDNGIIKAAKTFLEQGAESIVITRGGKGAILCTENDLLKIKPLKVNVINSVGSGDAFAGGCAVAIAQGKSISDAVILGSAAGAANAEKLTAGNISCHRVKELVKELKKKVEWSRL